MSNLLTLPVSAPRPFDSSRVNEVDTSLDLPVELLAAIARHGERAYPEECCGFLIGEIDGDVKRVRELLPVANTREDSARQRRYLIPPEAVLAAERRADQAGLDVLGVYHSHPDHPATPSEFDREHALPWWSYVIVAVRHGVAREAQVWRLTETGRFAIEPTLESLYFQVAV